MNRKTTKEFAWNHSGDIWRFHFYCDLRWGQATENTNQWLVFSPEQDACKFNEDDFMSLNMHFKGVLHGYGPHIGTTSVAWNISPSTSAWPYTTAAIRTQPKLPSFTWATSTPRPLSHSIISLASSELTAETMRVKRWNSPLLAGWCYSL